MTMTSSKPPSPPSASNDLHSSAQAEIVASALQALKENGVPANLHRDPQIMQTLVNLLSAGGNKSASDQVKEAAAETLSNLSQAAAAQDPNIHPQLQAQDTGPSSHPNGPPDLDLDLDLDLGQSDDANADGSAGLPPDSAASMVSVMSSTPGGTTDKPRRRGAGPPTVNGIIMGSEEWSRQRKDNHKEVERRRRGNINEGINELARIVPNGTGEKAKGAILSRSVQYIHHLKENEARNIEKWTLEKLLMDQAMGDLQSQLDDARAKVQEERIKREEAETQLRLIKEDLEKLKEGTKDESNKRARTGV